MRVFWIIFLVLAAAGMLSADAVPWTVDRTEIELPSIRIERPGVSEPISTAGASRHILSKSNRSADSKAVSTANQVAPDTKPITEKSLPIN